MTAPWNASWRPVKPEVGMVFRWFWRATKWDPVGAHETRTIEYIKGDEIGTNGGLWLLGQFQKLSANGTIEVIRSSRLTQPCRKGRGR